MTSPLPNPAPEAPPKPAGTPILAAEPTRLHDRSALRRSADMLRKLSAVAPFAAAYASFQAVLSSLPPSLSYDSLHYLLAVVSGVAAGGVVGCAVLIARKTGQRADAAVRTVQPPARSGQAGTGAIGTIWRDCHQALLDTVVSFDDPELGVLTGWPHFLHEAAAGYRPTSYGTAYGLKLAMALGDSDGRLDRAALADTLWKLRRPDGGWAARTQGAVGRPEATALVLGALSAAGCDPVRVKEATDVFEAMLAPNADPAALSSTFDVATAVRELSRIRPRSSRLGQLRTHLLDGAVQDARQDNLICWSSKLDTARLHVPSAAHTALAVLALARSRRVCGDEPRSRSAMEQGVRWLTLNRSLENQTDQIRRFVTADHWESLTVGLFTAAWVARALLESGATGVPGADALLEDAIRTIMRGQHGGTWEWDDGNRPLWMTYQGVSTLRAFALSRWTPL